MNYRTLITRNAERINLLHSRLHETFRIKQRESKKTADWEEACRQFHEQYPSLHFLDTGMEYREAVRSGHREAIEYALDFLELRPKFFRSGYMYSKLMRVLNNCPLSKSQRDRYLGLKEQYMIYRQKRRDADRINGWA